MSEEIRSIGDINGQGKHVAITIKEPTLTSVYPKPEFIQIVISTENARELERQLHNYLAELDYSR